MRTLFCLFLTLSSASAASLTVTIEPSPLICLPGQTVSFAGTLENTTTGEIFINSNSFTFSIAGSGVLDDSLFLTNAPISLQPSEITLPFDFLSVAIPLLPSRRCWPLYPL